MQGEKVKAITQDKTSEGEDCVLRDGRLLAGNIQRGRREGCSFHDGT